MIHALKRMSPSSVCDGLSPKPIILFALFVSLAFAAWAASIVTPWYILTLGLAYLLFLAVVLVRYEYSVYALIVLVPVYAGNIGFSLSPRTERVQDVTFIDRIPLSAPIILFSLVGLLLARWAAKKELTSRNPLFFPLLIFFLYASVTFAYAPSDEHFRIQLFILAINIGLYSLFFYAICDETMHKRVMWFCVASGLFHAFSVIALYFVGQRKFFHDKYGFSDFFSLVYEFYGGYQSQTEAISRRGEAFTFHNETALIMNVFFSLLAGLYCAERKPYRRVFIVLSMLVLIVAHLLTMSRSGTISLLLVAIFLILALKKLRRNFVVIALVFLVSAACIGQIENRLLKTALGQHDKGQAVLFQERMIGEGARGLSYSRLAMWKSGLEKIKSEGKMLFGLGVGGSQYYLKVPYMHSLYLSVLCDFGLVGIGIMFLIAIIVLQRCFSVFVYQDSYLQIMNTALIGALIALGSQGLLDFEYNKPFVWFILAMTIATSTLARKELLSSIIHN